MRRQEARSDTPASAPPRALYLREGRAAAGGTVTMVDISQPPGEVAMPALAGLIISACLGRPFPYRCDLGAGQFEDKALLGDFVVIPPGAPPTATMAAATTLRYLAVAPETVREWLELPPEEPIDFGEVHAHLSRDPLILQGLEALCPELARDDGTSRLFVDAMVGTLITRLKRLSNPDGTASPLRGGLTQRDSIRVIEYMHAHLSHALTINELAAVAQLSPCHFSRAFRETHGVPPHRYLLNMRLEHARDLLLHSEMSITEIAAVCSYTSQPLIRCYHRYIGTTPGGYRRGWQGTAYLHCAEVVGEHGHNGMADRESGAAARSVSDNPRRNRESVAEHADPSNAGGGGGDDPSERRALFRNEIARLTDRLYGTALQLTRNPDDAEEVVAEAVARAWARLDQLRAPERFEGWLFNILSNTFVSHWRCRRRRERTEVSIDAHSPGADDDHTDTDDSFSLFQKLHAPFLLWWGDQGEQFLDSLLHDDLARAVDALPADYRIVVVLVEIQGYRYREVAEMLALPLGTVRSRLSRGRARLQKALWQHARDAGLAVATRDPEAPQYSPSSAGNSR